ncbi:MAG TPA: hypothetical protein VMF61_07390, partial [Candidatus Acidoferrales bacterium]|nr:hypothetical protein [Candidatus Acidoferrales bacterium]
MPSDERLAALAARVALFHVTDRSLKRAQSAIEAALARGDVSPAEREAYLRAVRDYFESFGREARVHLRDVDRRLEHANQVHFNLTAERGVAVKRIEATDAVLR